ncbi:MAG: hypothetical protein JWL58_3379 [Streptosporangiaceae bacterium]|jgi:hypothetical protein|nr:hypothetical protein [Streptosporangiaceae bacterium]
MFAQSLYAEDDHVDLDLGPAGRAARQTASAQWTPARTSGGA